MLSTIDDAKRRLPLRGLARELGFDIPERDGQATKCWFPERHANGDRQPSFNLYADRYHCFGCGAKGDAIDLLGQVMGLDRAEAVRDFKRRAGLADEGPARPEVARPKEEERKPWPELRSGTNEELEVLAALRGLSPHGLALARDLGVLRFGRVCGRDAWLVTDESGRSAEARRMDGQRFPVFGTMPERKAHCLPGSRKAWPVGLMPRHSNPAGFRRVLLCEGSPDLLAGFHFAEHFGGIAMEWLPVAMLGRCCRIEREALTLLAGCHVRIVPHRDPDGGGFDAAETWAAELRAAGATVDFFVLPEGLRRKDGEAVKDLCDAANLPDRDSKRIADLFNL